MSKPNKRHKEKCQAYKQSGRREFNKAKKQERHEKRMAKFAKRREEGKTYEYKPNPYKQGSKNWKHERDDRAAKNTGKRLEIARMDSIWRKLNNELEAEERARKKAKGVTNDN